MVQSNNWISSICPNTSKEYTRCENLVDLIKTWLCNYTKYSEKYKITISDRIAQLREKNQLKIKKIKGRKIRIKKK